MIMFSSVCVILVLRPWKCSHLYVDPLALRRLLSVKLKSRKYRFSGLSSGSRWMSLKLRKWAPVDWDHNRTDCLPDSYDGSLVMFREMTEQYWPRLNSRWASFCAAVRRLAWKMSSPCIVFKTP